MMPLSRKSAVAVSMLLGLICAPAANAYYFGYSPYGSVGSFWYPLRSFLGPARALSYGYGYNPLYLGSSVLNTAGYGLMRMRPTMTAGDYVDEEPVNAPRQRVKPSRPTIEPTDQISHARWQHPKQDPIGSGWAGGYAPQFQQPAAPILSSAYNASDGHQMSRLSQLTGLPAPGVAPAVAYVPAPVVAYQPVPVVASAPVEPVAHPSGNAPFAQGFVNLVNHKYRGDIARALADPEAKGWARCLGVLDDDVDSPKALARVLTAQRIQLIQHILGEDSVPAATRVEMIKPLLRN